MTADPLVSVVTPVYNGEAYLRQCIESVLAQTYGNWEYVIVDNASRDATPEITRAYAARDPRIRVHTNREVVSVGRNHNIAFRQISAASAYCKVLHADDTLFPECLARMVALAEAHPSVGIVGAYCLHGTEVKCDGVPHARAVLAGREVCRLALFEDAYVFLSPTCLLIRADVVRGAGGALYDESHLHADLEMCFAVLRHCDFGFVPQVLTYVRPHDGSLTASRAERLNTYPYAWLDILNRYGPAYLSDEERRRLVRRRLNDYYRFLGRSVLRLSDREFWRYHRGALASLGYPFSWPRIVGVSASEAVRELVHPLRAAGRAVLALRERRGPRAA